MNMKLYKIRDIENLYVDAVVTDDKGEVLFLSVWGLDTTIQEFIAKLSISRSGGGLSQFYISLDNGRVEFCRIGHVDRLVKHTGRAAKASLFNGLVHLWLHDVLATTVDYANRCCLLLKQHTEDESKFQQRLWQAICTVCPVPLLPEWQSIVAEFTAREWIQRYPGIAVDAYKLDFSSPHLASAIALLIAEGKLQLPKKDSHLSLA